MTGGITAVFCSRRRAQGLAELLEFARFKTPSWFCHYVEKNAALKNCEQKQSSLIGEEIKGTGNVKNPYSNEQVT